MIIKKQTLTTTTCIVNNKNHWTINKINESVNKQEQIINSMTNDDNRGKNENRQWIIVCQI